MTRLLWLSLVVCFHLLLLPIGHNCRQLSSERNPNCKPSDKCVDDINLVHIKSVGDKDLVHYLWSSVVCLPPSLVIIKSDLKSDVSVRWDDLFRHTDTACNQSRHLSEFLDIQNQTLNRVEFEVSRLFLFSDADKTGTYKPNDTRLEANWNDNTEGFVWNKMNTIKNTKDSVEFSFTNDNNRTLLPNEMDGKVTFNLRVDNSDGRSDDLPHLAFTETSASISLTLDGVKTNDTTFKNPRIYAVMAATGSAAIPTPDFEEDVKIDDEYTPGVFKTITLNMNKKDGKEETNSFVNWKPIAYNSDEKIIANTFDVIHQMDKPENATQPQTTHTYHLTFGAADDDVYYDEKHYATFAMVVGVGSAPTEELSLLVKLVIAIGFGLPALIMLVSAVYIVVKKVRNRNADNLLLRQTN